jgi:hypothetical protein
MIRVLVLLLALTLLTACGGSGGSISGTGVKPIGGDVVIGTIEGFGSVVVNRRRLESDNAAITVNGIPSGQADLRVGMQVQVMADLRTLTATRIDYVPLVVGPVRDIDRVSRTLRILGHTIGITGNTRFDGIDEASVGIGSVLEISGLVNANRQIVATLIRAESDTDEYQVIATINTLQQGFDISLALSDFEFGIEQLEQQLQLIEDPDAFDVFTSRRAVVTLAEDGNNSSPTLTYLLPQDQFVEGAAIDLLQAVTSVSGDGVFDTDNFLILAQTDTVIVFSNGAAATVSDVQPNSIIRVTGRFSDNSGTILADIIEIETPD